MGRKHIRWVAQPHRAARLGLLMIAVAAPAGLSDAAGTLSLRSSSIAPVTASVTANIAAQQNAANVAAQSNGQLAAISRALAAAETAQTVARNLAQAAPSTVQDGLATGGLVPDSGLAGTGVANPVTDWTGASTPTQTSAGGQTTVTVNQTAAQAILSWNSFNVAKNTTVQFNQQQSSWVALNRINDTAAPAQILGAIKAPGQVYLIDPNGIIFGGASQINVGALVASSAAISDSQFTSDGIYSPLSATTYTPSFTNSGGPISVQAGAQITTAAPPSVTIQGGYVLLMGTQVNNAGSITTPDGQTELAAGDDFYIRPGYGSSSLTTSTNPASTTNVNEIAVKLNAKGSSLTGGSGAVSNSGIITSTTGDITLAGETVVQNGVLESTSTVSQRGTIHLLTSASDHQSDVILGANSLTLVAPDLSDTTTAFDGARAALIAQSAANNATRTAQPYPQFDDLGTLPDLSDESRIEIVSGHTVEFQGGSQTVAQGGQVAVSATERVQTDAGAVIDVAGVYGVSLPVSNNDIEVNIQGFEQRDNPQNRQTANLNSTTVYVDQRQLVSVAAGAGGYAAARDYTAGGLLEVSGYLNTTGHTIGEWSAIGGSIEIATGGGGAIVAQSGSVFNIDGGSIQYQAGLVNQSYLLGENGRVYNVNTAPAYITYAGVYKGFVVDHSAWGVTQTYNSPLSLPSAIAEAGYTEGRDAGTLTLDSPTVLDAATLEDGAVNGTNQTVAAPANVTDPYTLAQNVVAEPGTLDVAAIGAGTLLASNTNVVFTNATASATTADGLTAASKIPSSDVGISTFNATALSGDALGGLDVLTNGKVSVTAPLTFAAGAAVSLYGSSDTVSAAITDPSGSVSIGNYASIGGTLTELAQTNGHTGNVVLNDNATLDTAGLWTNLALDSSGPNFTAFANGGAVTLVSATNLDIATGSGIDASAGADISASGSRSGGAGGAVSVTVVNATGAASTGDLTLDGTLQSTGFTSGGALTLAAAKFEIGDVPASSNPAIVTLQPGFFSSGFSSYTLTGQTTIAPNTTINVTEPTEQFTNASATVPTGGDTAAGSVLTLLPLYTANPQLTSITQRPGASLTLNSTYSFTLGAGSAITVDPKQAINLSSYGEMVVDGALTARGGTINLTDNAKVGSLVPYTTYANGHVLSVWIGGTAVLSTAAVPFTASNAADDSIALAPAGGTINVNANDADVIIQPGALLNAAGAAATEQPNAKDSQTAVLGVAASSAAPISLAGAGGTIALSSNNGLFLYGTMLAPAGGANAAGGTLSLSLNSDNELSALNISDAPRVITITQADTAPALPASLTPGTGNAALVRGTGQISAAQIAAGGFGTLSFSALDAFMFDGNVTLAAAQSITFAQGIFADSSATGAVVISAPHVTLNGAQEIFITDANGNQQPAESVAGYSPVNSSGAFTVNAGLIDVENAVGFGGIETVANGTITKTRNLKGFATVNLASTGDIRFLAAGANSNLPATSLVSTGNINLTASTIYSTAAAAVLAGYTPATSAKYGNFSPDGVLTIAQAAGTVASAPYDVSGALNFYAATINDSGSVWDPLGKITFGSTTGSNSGLFAGNGDSRAVISLLPGSLTSVSAAGLTVPYGGTTDGVSYDVNGATATLNGTATFGLNTVSLVNGSNKSPAIGTGSITLDGLQISVAKGATIDLSGGGSFTGEGFISGEGGSIDVLAAPLLQTSSGGAKQPTLSADPVYAIVAGTQPQVAPVQDFTQTGVSGSLPAVGEQIIIPAGVPGLPAGRYTLLPATYALNPGGYRVEFDGAANLAAPSVVALPNGSYAVAGHTGIVDTSVVSSLPANLTITPAATVQTYADYDTEGYAQFLEAQAAQVGAVRPALPEDAGTLNLYFPALDTASLSDAGVTDFSAASGGVGGTLQISGALQSTTGNPQFAIYGSTAPAPKSGTVALSAAAIDAFDPTILEIGDAHSDTAVNTAGITLDPGATLTAARVILTALNDGITLQGGSEIDTLGQGSLFVDSNTTGPYTDGGASVLDVGNGYLTYTDAGGASNPDYGPINIEDGATIYTDGSIAFSTGASVTIGLNAVYGGAYLDLALPEINVGDPSAVGATATPGLTLTQAVLARLTAGVPASGVPAVQTLVLSASQSLNFFGTTGLNLTGSGVQLVIDSPAIYGYGTASDVATVSANTIVWNGDLVNASGVTSSGAPGGVVTNGAGTGQGTLDFDAQNIIFGYSSLDQPTRDVPLNRITLGFGTVNLNASTEITANNQGTLAVYQALPKSYGHPDTGGVLNLNTPLLTGANAATMGFTAGGALTVAAPAGAAPAIALVDNTAGAEIDLTGAAVSIDSAVILPSGKLNVQATGTTAGQDGITLGAGSNLDLAGAVNKVLGTTTYGAGGSLIAGSASGGITQDAGGAINVSATGNNAGAVAFTADAGALALGGTLTGSAPAAYASGSFTAAAQTIGNFAVLNTALNTGGFYDARSFEIGQGDLTVGTGVAARSVSISLDNGSLTVDGTIDASFGSAGNISLAAANDLTLTQTAVLDANGTVLQTDSNGQAIASANTPEISLTTSTGELTLASGATLELASADSVARGNLEMNVPRSTTNYGDANIAAASGVKISGAATVAVNAFATYTGLATPNKNADGAPNALITQAYLDGINSTDTVPYMAAAANSTDLQTQLSNLSSDSGTDAHLRPGVEIVSPNDLTVAGDIDLSGYRYGPDASPGSYAGEPGVLVIRAGGNLNVFGSITDGFAAPPSDVGTSYASGWVLYAGQEPYGQNIVVPVKVTLAAGSSLGVDTTVNYAVPIDGGTFASNASAPTALTVSGSQTVTIGFVATSRITLNGNTEYKAGQYIRAGDVLADGSVIDSGGRFPFPVTVGPVTWPANTPFTITSNDNPNPAGAVVLTQNLSLKAGSIIPGDSYIAFPNGAASISVRSTVAGTQGQIDPLAQVLPAGDLSWSIQLVSGANTAAADTGSVQAAAALGKGGNLTLADTHYGLGASDLPVPAFSVIRTGTGALSLISGGSLTEGSDYGIYTAGTQAAGVTSDYNLAQGVASPDDTVLGSYNSTIEALNSGYQANYTQGGGNVLVAAQGNLTGFINTNANPDNNPAVGLTNTDALGSWLWLQGGAGQPAAWWVEFGVFAPTGVASGTITPQLDGFQGIGTLGGGNLTVTAGGNASGLNLAVASTGRAQADGTLLQTGGGNLQTSIGGALNFVTGTGYGISDQGGLITNLRGKATLTAGSIGTIVPLYNGATTPSDDTRILSPLVTEIAQIDGGIDLAPGDGTVTVNTRGDQVIDAVVNPGVQDNQTNTTPIDFTSAGKTYRSDGGGTTIFSLWSNTTGVSLSAAGGDVTPYRPSSGLVNNFGTPYAPSLSVVAQNGNIDFAGGSIELAPSATGALSLIAGGSIYGSATNTSTVLSISGADPSVLATPANPLINVVSPITGNTVYTNTNLNQGLNVIGFGADTPSSSLHADGQAPALVLAGTDIVGLSFGQVNQISGTTSNDYVAAVPFDIQAGNDIVASGSVTAPDIFLNLGAGDVTSITAGRDILESSFDIAGPGTLAVQAGRNFYEADQGVLESIGPLYNINSNNRDGGAGITVLAGTGSAGADYSAFDALYINPDSTLSLQDASAIISENDAALLTWLQTNFGYTGTAAGAYGYFQQLSPAQQHVFLLDRYYAMLNQSGLEYNESSSVRYKSYALGRNAIATLFPTTSASGQPITYAGDITMFGASGIHTDFGGALQTLTPGGETLIGVEGAAPPASAGFITQGSGDIDIYSEQSVLLGESRVLTTFGGNILVWSAEGNINAGKGAKTSVDYTPIERVYDNYGNVALSPTVPSTGAGIGTLNPIPTVTPGDINLVAPVGIVDAGEAGIRVSGNLNIAAAHVENGANISVQGTSAGVPTASAVNVGALTSAGNTAGASAAAADNAGKTGAASALPSIWIVEILGYSDTAAPPPEKRKHAA